MGQRVVVLRTDDITGKEIAEGEGETIRFAVAGIEYEIDLDDKSAKKFHEALKFYIDHGRKVGRSNVSSISKARGRSKNDVDLGAVRSWAKDNGYEVSDRGRVAGNVLEAYQAANS